MKRTIRAIATTALAFALSWAAFAEDASIEASTGDSGNTGDELFTIDENELFGDDSASLEIVDQSKKGSGVSAFLKNDAVKIGGNLSGSLSPSWTWDDPWHGDFDASDPDSALLSPDVAAKLTFDARPNERTRFFGAMKTNWPFEDSGSLSGEDSSASNVSVPNVSVFELFADRSWNDTLFFRFGKHTVKWGVGYFWSPADVINIGKIDVTDPSAQLEGPISLRLLMPFAGTQRNLWAYAIVPNVDDPSTLKPEDVAYAAKYEFLLGNYEIGMGGFWQRDMAPKGMLTATGSIGKFNLFGEAVASWGSDKTFVDDVLTLKASKDDDGLYFSGTAGAAYINSKRNVTGYAQYYYNGNGYTDSRRKDLIADGRDLLASLAGSSYEGQMTQALKGLVYESGRHYAGFFVQKAKFLADDLTAGALVVANLSDLSGFVQPTVSYEFFEGFSGALTPTFYWSTDALWGSGDDGEYVILANGPAMTLSLKFTLGTGNF